MPEGNRKPVFDAVRTLRGGAGYTQAEVTLLDAALDVFAESLPLVLEATPVPEHKFKLSKTSLDRLAVVRPELRRCVELAIDLSLVDFGVNQSIRTIDQQKAAVAAGNSRTMHSKHLKQADGWVWAVDLVAWVNGAISWDFPLYGSIAHAMDQAATQLGYASHIRWGCAWDRVLSDFGGAEAAYQAEAEAYAKRHPGKDLVDGPHFEWVL